MEGFQLWLNLAAKDKMCEPGYVDIQSNDLPEIDLGNGVLARLIAGSSHGQAGAMQRELTEPVYIDVHFDGAGEFRQALPAAHNAFIYVYRGQVQLGDQEVELHRMAILANDPDADGVVIRSNGPARVLLIAGRPLNEPIAQHGPFVMNTQQELFQAVADYQDGKFA